MRRNHAEVKTSIGGTRHDSCDQQVSLRSLEQKRDEMITETPSRNRVLVYNSLYHSMLGTHIPPIAFQRAPGRMLFPLEAAKPCGK